MWYKVLFFRVRKLLNLRVFDDENGVRWKHSVKDMDYEILCVSQVRQGLNKPGKLLITKPHITALLIHTHFNMNILNRVHICDIKSEHFEKY